MAIIIKRRDPDKRRERKAINEEGRSKVTNRKAPKTPTKKEEKKLVKDAYLGKRKANRSMGDTEADFVDKTDKELIKFIEPREENKDKKTHRLVEEQLEARLVLLHRMQIRRAPAPDIRQALGVGVTMYYKLREQLSSRMRLDIAKVDVPYLIGDTLGFYDEIRSMALTVASDKKTPSVKLKLTALSVALQAEKDKNHFLAHCGVYAPEVIEHLVRVMVSGGNLPTAGIDSTVQKNMDAEEILSDLVQDLTTYSRKDVTDVEFSETRTDQSESAPEGTPENDVLERDSQNALQDVGLDEG